MTSASDDPEAYIAGDRRHALATGQPMADRVNGSALFADISGFTPLTEALVDEVGESRGAEFVGATLERVFTAILAELHQHGGSAIYFSGDAVTGWIDGDDGHLAVSCALAMQAALRTVGVVVLPSGRRMHLAMKVAVAVGAARRFVVGDPDIQLIDVLAGALIDDLAAAEGYAQQGTVVLETAALAHLGADIEVAETVTAGGRTFGSVTRLLVPVARPAPPPVQPRLPTTVVRPWLLPPVYERLRTGHGELLAELRPAVPLFLRFGGIDYDRDPDPRRILNEFVVAAQRVIDAFGGSALQLTLGDKGAYLYAVFGAPIAHEDDEARACAAALDLLLLEGKVTGLQIGIAQGRLRSGTYGHPTRRTYCCLGDAVNLAARLMSAAPTGQIYVADGVAASAADRYEWAPTMLLRVKGKAAPVAVRALLGRRHRTPGRTMHRRHALAMVGRDRELALIGDRLADAVGGHGQVVAISAEAGMGKSRLLAEVARVVVAGGIDVHEGEAQAFGTTSAYFAWRDVWAGLFGTTEPDELAVEVGRDLSPRVPLLSPLLGRDIPDNDLTTPLDAKVRKASLELLLVQYLQSRGTPVVILLEDAQWLDPLSLDLLDALARAIDRHPVLIVLAYRPEGLAWRGRLTSLPHMTELELGDLPPAAAEQMVDAKISQLFDIGSRPDALVRIVLERYEGNPFHIEELLNFVRSQGVDPLDAVALAQLTIPEGVNRLVLSRIDQLSEQPRRTLKVASVIGRLFDTATLRGSYPQLGRVESQLVALRGRDLILLEQEEELVYLFKHIAIRDVAYDSMPYATREMLHERVAAFIERIDPGGQQHLDLLAHHYWLSANEPKKYEYLIRAADAAQAAYANEVAIDYFRRATTLRADAETLRKLGQVLELVGEWPEAERRYLEAIALAEGDALGVALARSALAEVARKQGRYDESTELLRVCEQAFADLGAEDGRGRVLHLAGTLAAQQGRYDEARQNYTASLDIRRALADVKNEAALLGNLGIVAEYEGDYEQARRLNQQALELRMTTGDQWAIGASLVNLGMIALLQHDLVAARDRFTESMRLHREVGDPWFLAIGQNNLATTLRRLGELGAAGHHYAESLRAYTQLGDQWAQAIVVEDIAVLAVSLGDPADALRLVGAADAVRDRIGSPRSATQAQDLDAALAPARAQLGRDADGYAHEGRALDTIAAIDLALRVCLP